jgi:transposase-like protein
MVKQERALVFWLGVLTDLKGVEDMLITATDNLNGFTQTIKNAFPESQTQICVVKLETQLIMSSGR